MPKEIYIHFNVIYRIYNIMSNIFIYIYIYMTDLSATK